MASCNPHLVRCIAALCHTAPLSCSTYEYVVSVHQQLQSSITDHSTSLSDHTDGAGNDALLASVRLSTFILTSCLLSSNEETKEDRF